MCVCVSLGHRGVTEEGEGFLNPLELLYVIYELSMVANCKARKKN